MQNLSVTLVQADQRWENVKDNLTHYESILSAIEHTDLIVLPEMFQTGFSMNTSLAETMEGKSIQWLKDLAERKNCAIFTSLMISENSSFYNRGVFITPNGNIDVYDKRKTFGLARENEFFSSGENSKTIDWKGWKIQLQICYDLRFPEISRNEIDSDGNPKYDLLLYVANWPEKRSTHWNTLLKARAIENQSYVVGLNRVGTDKNNFTYSGDSKMIDAQGGEIALTRHQEELRTIVINKSNLNKIREMLPFLRDR